MVSSSGHKKDNAVFVRQCLRAFRRGMISRVYLLLFIAWNIFCVNAFAYPDSLPDKSQNSEEMRLSKGPGNYNVVIICLDTLRADHLGCYGYFRNTSPHIDRLAKDGILFKWAFAQSNFTLPSIASLFTSKYMHSHKVDTIEKHLPDSEITIAEVLKDNGYQTAAFIYNATQFNVSYGLNQGFDTYFFGEEEDRRPSFVKTLPAALQWIDEHKNKKFFVFLHSNDVHEPYHSPFENYFDPEYKGNLDYEYLATGIPGRDLSSFHENNLHRTPREITHIIAHYDGGIKYADGFVGSFMRQLRDWKLLDKTIVILLSDHGEILADRGMRFLHGFSLHDEEVHVALIIAHPGMKKKNVRINTPVQLIDVMPTVIDFLNINIPALRMEGRSLVDVVAGKTKHDFNKYVYAEAVSGESAREKIYNYQVMVRTPSWKLISSVWKVGEQIMKNFPLTIQMHNGVIISLPQEDGFELFNLRNDWKEAKNLIGKIYKKIEDELLGKLLTFSYAR